MTLPSNCDWCGAALAPWDPDEDTPCKTCGNLVPTWEHLAPDQRRLRMAVIARREAIEKAPEIEPRGDVL